MSRHLSALGGGTEWLNSAPLTAAELHGHVVLVDFCTYTCINWLRSLPHVRAWAGRYDPHGLVVIGVHTPEFDVERDTGNVRRALDRLRVEHPVVLDNGYLIWDAFGNRYWPARYLLDARGEVRHHRFGEGDYERTEGVIRQLLAEAGAGELGDEPARADPSGVEAEAGWADLRSPETYLGHERTENFASPEGAAGNAGRVYSFPARLPTGHWALAGEWTVRRQAAVLGPGGGRLAVRFHARDLHLVLAPEVTGRPVRFRVRLDGRSPGAAAGLDVDDADGGTVTEPRLYQLIRQPGPVEDRTFEIEFAGPGVRAYAVTFG